MNQEKKVIEAARLYVAAVRRLIQASMAESDARVRDESMLSRLYKINARARAEAAATEAESRLVEAVEELER